MINIGLLHTTIRGDEKLIINAAKKRSINLELIDVRSMILNPQLVTVKSDILLERCISTVKGNYAVNYFEGIGKKVINDSNIAQICQDKFLTSLKLAKFNINTPRFAVVFSETDAIKAINQIGGYPVIIKPPLGSWGRLLAKVNDQDSLEAVLEHKTVLGTPPHGAFYIQEYIKKQGFDIRAFVIDGVTICAIARLSDHWITNTARGGKAINYKVTKDLSIICKRVSDVIGGGILAIDLMESDSGFIINEVNHTMEFKNSEIPTHVSISGAIIDYCIKQYKKL